MLLFVRAAYPEVLDKGSETFGPVALPIKDITLIDPYPGRDDLCYLWVNGKAEPEYICDHSMEELAQALGANVAHMQGKFETALVEEVVPPKTPAAARNDFPSPASE